MEVKRSPHPPGLETSRVGQASRKLSIKRGEDRSNPCRELTLSERPVSDSKGDVDDLRFGGLDLMSVEDEEHVCGDESDPLIPIEEGVILDEAKAVGRCEVGEVRVRVVPPSMLGASDCRVQKAFIPESRLSAVGPDLVGMRRLDGGTWDPARLPEG